MKYGDETQAVVQAFNQKIAKLSQMRDLLADPRMLALVKEIVENPAPSVRTGKHCANEGARPYGGIVGAAFEAVEAIGDEPFTKWDLAKKLGQKGFEIKNPKNGLFYPIDRLLAARIINVIEEGGGNRPNVYQRARASRTAEAGESIEQSEGSEVGTSASATARPLRFRNGMDRIAVECIVRLAQSFDPQELITEMRAAGYTFAGNSDLSIQPCLRRLVKQEILDIIRERDGPRPAIYKRRDKEPRTRHNITSSV